jgi:hypothetical protein
LPNVLRTLEKSKHLVRRIANFMRFMNESIDKEEGSIEGMHEYLGQSAASPAPHFSGDVSERPLGFTEKSDLAELSGFQRQNTDFYALLDRLQERIEKFGESRSVKELFPTPKLGDVDVNTGNRRAAMLRGRDMLNDMENEVNSLFGPREEMRDLFPLDQAQGDMRRIVSNAAAEDIPELLRERSRKIIANIRKAQTSTSLDKRIDRKMKVERDKQKRDFGAYMDDIMRGDRALDERLKEYHQFGLLDQFRQ